MFIAYIVFLFTKLHLYLSFYIKQILWSFLAFLKHNIVKNKKCFWINYFYRLWKETFWNLCLFNKIPNSCNIFCNRYVLTINVLLVERKLPRMSSFRKQYKFCFGCFVFSINTDNIVPSPCYIWLVHCTCFR